MRTQPEAESAGRDIGRSSGDFSIFEHLHTSERQWWWPHQRTRGLPARCSPVAKARAGGRSRSTRADDPSSCLVLLPGRAGVRVPWGCRARVSRPRPGQDRRSPRGRPVNRWCTLHWPECSAPSVARPFARVSDNKMRPISQNVTIFHPGISKSRNWGAWHL
jgi:hypothetical protein